MKQFRRINILMAAMIVATGITVAEGAQIEKPAVLDEAMLSLTISDFHGLLDGLGSTASQVSPMMNATTIKSMLGMQLGDPELAGIAAGKGLAVVALDPKTVFGVIELSAAQLAIYTNKLAATGMQSRYHKGLLVVGKTAEVVQKGIAAAPRVRATLLARRTPTLRIGLQPAGYIAANSEQIDGMLKMMPAMMGQGMQAQAKAQGQSAEAMQGIAKLLEGELRVLLSLMKQVQAMEITVAPGGGSLRIDEVLEPVAGSRLAALVNAPRQNQWNPKIQSGAAGSSAFMIDFLIENSDALAAFIAAETEQLVSEMKLEGAEVKRISAYMQKYMGICGGTISESLFGGTTPGLNINYTMEVSDEKAALALLRNMQAELKATGFMDLYANMGMPMSFEFKENTRQHKGVSIHRLTMKISMEQMPEIQRQQFEAMNLSNMKYEIAILDGIMAYTMGDTRMEDVIDGIRNPKAGIAPLKARSVFPVDGFYYGDIDLGRYMEFVAAFMPAMPTMPMPFETISKLLKGAEPITSAGHMSGGRVQWSMNMPADLLARIGQAAMAIQMQKMQQMHAPAPAPAPATPQP